MIHVLLVEDDVEIARIIRYFLSGSGEYSVVWAATAQDAVIASRDWFDIILLDVMLPDDSGIDLCSRLREWHRCPIIFLSCLDDSETIIDALNHGGDDYIVKPFDNRVLIARIQANLRRVKIEHEELPENLLRCSGFSIDAAAHVLIRDGKQYPLPPMEFRILSYMMQHPGKCFRSSELYRLIWGRDSFGDNRTVAVHIHSIRKKIEEDASAPRFLRSLWGKGYMFDPDGGLREG